jgi:hypothetical protein
MPWRGVELAMAVNKNVNANHYAIATKLAQIALIKLSFIQ